MTYYLTTNDPLAHPAINLMRAAFPQYQGRTFKIRIQEGPLDVRSYWDGGSRNYYVFISLANSRRFEMPQQSAFDPLIEGADRVRLPSGIGCVEHTIFCGKDLGLTLILNPSDAAPLLPSADKPTDDEAHVLIATASLKNSYGGETNIRFRRLNERFGMTEQAYEAAIQSCIEKGWMDRRRAITAKGRNVIEDHPDRFKIS